MYVCVCVVCVCVCVYIYTHTLNSCICTEDTHKNVHKQKKKMSISSTANESKKLETIQVFITDSMNKQTIVYSMKYHIAVKLNELRRTQWMTLKKMMLRKEIRKIQSYSII